MKAALGLLAVLAACAAWASADLAPGVRFKIGPADLPAPHATPSVSNGAIPVPRPADAQLRVPPGFEARLFAANLSHPRWLAVAPNGDVLLAESSAGKLTLLRDADGDGRPELVTSFVDGLARPHGMAFHGDWLYVADTERVWRIPYRAGDTRARARPEAVTADGALGPGSGHWTRNVVVDPAGRHLYVAIGSRGNIAEEPLPRATIQRFLLDGSGQASFALGLRNPIGIAFHPATGRLWTVVNERDGLGDGLVPDYLAEVVEGAHYGWPHAYLGGHLDPRYGRERPDIVARARAPELWFVSHSAPIGLAFYDGAMFPPEYRGDAFVALQGSWNSAKPVGYMLARVPFKDGRPLGHYESFATGFWVAGSETARVIGKPAGVAVARDGALLVADDVGRALWRISYRP
ncbi:MAG: sorbosone dehydrogenase family protein [Alphaproteobacteria bacterium]|nr:sorbosone dehydrogenase family protein [Alphaproteobacteria bacterium]